VETSACEKTVLFHQISEIIVLFYPFLILFFKKRSGEGSAAAMSNVGSGYI